MRLLPTALLAVLLTAPAAAQSVPDLVTRGVAAFDARNPAAALKDYQAALAIDSASFFDMMLAAISGTDGTVPVTSRSA